MVGEIVERVRESLQVDVKCFEAVCEGVPMVAWPLYAEQKLNKVILVEEMKVGLGVKGNKEGLVSITELGN